MKTSPAKISSLGKKMDRRYEIVAIALIILFVVFSLLPDLRPHRTIRLHYAGNSPEIIDFLLMELHVSPEMRYHRAHGGDYPLSLPYRLALRVVSLLFPGRLACLRVTSILAAVGSLFLFFLIARELFSPAVGCICLFAMTVSPLYLELMRSFGYMPLTILSNTLFCYFLVVSLRGPRRWGAVFGMSAVAYLTISLYALGRLVLFLPFIIYGIWLRRNWRKLAGYVACFIILVVAIDAVFDDSRFNVSDFFEVGDEWMQTREPAPLPIKVSHMLERGFNNLWQLRDFLFRGVIYDTENDREKLVSILLVPFFFLGLGRTILRRTTADILLISWFSLTAIPPIFSSEYTDSRLLQAFGPYFILISLGVVETFAFIRKRLKTPSRLLSRSLTAIFAGALGCMAVFNLNTYLLQTSRVPVPYNSSQLEKLVCYMSEQARFADRVWYRGQIHYLVWGNPYFDRRVCDISFVRKMGHLPPLRPDLLSRQISAILKKDHSTLLIVSTQHIHPSPDPLKEDLVYIRQLEENPDRRITITRLPELEDVHFIFIDPGRPAG